MAIRALQPRPAIPDGHATRRSVSKKDASNRWEKTVALTICENDDIKDVMGEAKGRGYDTKAIRTILRLRKKDKDERMEEEAILQTYMAALGME